MTLGVRHPHGLEDLGRRVLLADLLVHHAEKRGEVQLAALIWDRQTFAKVKAVC